MIKELLEQTFGITLGDSKKKMSPQVVKDVHDDGAYEAILSGGMYYDSYFDILNSLINEKELIQTYREIAYIPEVDQAIIEIVGDSIVYPKNEVYPVKINTDDVEFSSGVKKKIIEEFENILSLLEFDTKADDIFRKWYVDGRLPLYLHVDGNKITKGISKIIPIDPVQIKKIREIRKEIDTDGIEKITGIEEKFIYFPDDNTPREFIHKSIGSYVVAGMAKKGIELTKDSVVYSTSGQMNEDRTMILSFLHKAIKPANQLSQIEDSMIIYRISRAPERRVFYIDTGNLPKAKAEAYLNSIMAKFKNKLSYDGTTGKIKNQTHIRSILEDYWLPRKEGGKGTEISTMQGGTSFAGITEETNYFKNKLYKALNVPVGRLDSESTFVFGKSSEITRDEVKFAKFVNSLRNQFAKTIFDDILRVQLVAKNIIKTSEWDIIQEGIFYQWEDDSHFAEMKVLEVLEKKLEVLEKVSMFTVNYFSKDYVRKNILFQTEDEIKQLKKDREKEAIEEPDPVEGGEGDDEGGGQPPDFSTPKTVTEPEQLDSNPVPPPKPIPPGK